MKQPRCGLCHLPILDRILSALDRNYHPACFTCATCDTCLDGGQFVADTTTDTVTCRDCYVANKAPVCHKCKQAIVSEPGKLKFPEVPIIRQLPCLRSRQESDGGNMQWEQVSP